MNNVKQIAQSAKEATHKLARTPIEIRNKALLEIAKNIDVKKEDIFKANTKDLEASKELVQSGEISQATYNRLKLDENKMRAMTDGIRDVIKLEDPINEVFWRKKLDDELILEKISCPIGVIGVIFEARPDVITQISALAIKSGNAVLLKGGKEAQNTNRVLSEIICTTLKDFELTNTVSLLESREDVAQMLALDEYINLIIPRGSNELVKYIQNNTKIPVLGHASGICHLYIDKDADFEMAKKIAIDSKMQYPSACNAVETILMHKDFKDAEKFVSALKDAGIEIVKDPKNWDKEYGDTIASIKTVESLKDAIHHINAHGSGHTDSIITQNNEAANVFMQEVDSAGVFHNVSTRFSDGFRYGFGAEVGISTNKTHARGPVGLDGLTTYKYKLRGNGQIAQEYCDGTKCFKHEIL